MSFEDVYIQAESALRRGDAAGAESVLAKQWPKLAAAPADALHIMGAVRVAQFKGGEAAEFLRNAVRAEPDGLRHHIMLGHILSADGDVSGAADAYAAAARIDPNWPGLLFTQARAAYRAGRYAEAEAIARQLTATKPDVPAWDTLSCALREQGKAQEAVAAAEQGLLLMPNHPGALHSYAAALVLAGRASDALRALDDLAGHGVRSGAVEMTRARTLEALGRRADAEATLAAAAKQWPNDPAVRKAIDARRH